MSVELISFIVVFVAGAACLFGAKQMCAFAASRSLWAWQRKMALSPINIMSVRLIGAIAMICSAFAVWSGRLPYSN
jgi:hypothetical protein